MSFTLLLSRSAASTWPHLTWHDLLAMGLVAGALLGGGCATTTSSISTPVTTRQPSTVLEGADLDAARSVAMAAARSKGWTVNPNSDHSLILERKISPLAPQAQALGQQPDAPAPRIQVQTMFTERNTGTEVVLRAFVRVNPETEHEKRIEYTEDYQTDLAISLSALQSAWLTAAHRLASPAPIPRNAPALADIDVPSVTPSEPETATDPTPWREQEAQWPETQSQVGADPQDTLAARRPMIDQTAPNQMLVLDTQMRTGTWAYYAERYAQQQGCTLGEQGAVLLQKTPEFELHEVVCTNRANRLVKCQGGLCQTMR